MTYPIKLTDPDTGKKYRVTIYADLPKQMVRRGNWEILIEKIVRKDELKADKVTWRKM